MEVNLLRCKTIKKGKIERGIIIESRQLCKYFNFLLFTGVPKITIMWVLRDAENRLTNSTISYLLDQARGSRLYNYMQFVHLW